MLNQTFHLFAFVRADIPTSWHPHNALALCAPHGPPSDSSWVLWGFRVCAPSQVKKMETWTMEGCHQCQGIAALSCIVQLQCNIIMNLAIGTESLAVDLDVSSNPQLTEITDPENGSKPLFIEGEVAGLIILIPLPFAKYKFMPCWFPESKHLS